MTDNKIPIKIAIIGGSGLDDPDILKNRKEKFVQTPFGCPSDALIYGTISDIPVILLARHDRRHTTMPSNVNYRANIWALKQEGVTHIIASTATGSLQEHIKPGDVVILNSFIDRTTKREVTFYDGKPDHPIGVIHLPMEPAFSEPLRETVIKVARDLKIDVHETGTVVAIEGPRFSSKAESFMHRQWGADVINMTSVPEVVLAKEAGILYVSIALATDYDCWRETGEKVTALDVLKTFKQNVVKVIDLICGVVPEIYKQNWDNHITELRETVEQSVLLPKD
ncbi:S-methyl-5'-thioadenosine phosphorylase-like [Aethina tumida]|uniref:S-methyl-5'-thioadenosine phosphorylase-like n=1 Tax=Aethina tumida TaxID=116153 RepID=UPI0021477188|nr:S-methyl-5'-thioadenosine phosphorylase-like [Aethina tumida]XP_049821264.1 S-methyl-5'-thioadenosine phosphorylase-like [Aethina tumida]